MMIICNALDQHFEQQEAHRVDEGGPARWIVAAWRQSSIGVQILDYRLKIIEYRNRSRMIRT